MSRLAGSLFLLAARGGLTGRLARVFLLLLFSCDVSAGAHFEGRPRLPHPLAIVVGSGVRIGKDVTICQGVTIGHNGRAEYPVIEDGSKIYPNSTIVGSVRIGARAVIGANALVVKNVPAGTVVRAPIAVRP